jgi:hypothetical protein
MSGVVTASNLNLSYGDTLFKGAGQLQRELERAGYRGVMWSDVPTLNPVNAAMGGLGVRWAKRGFVRSLHQSWRQNHFYDLPAIARKKGIVHAVGEAAFVLGLPHISRSLDHLQRVQDAARTPLPVVVHPAQQLLGNQAVKNLDYRSVARKKRFGPLIAQPTAEWLAAEGVPLDNPEEAADILTEKAQAAGIAGLAFDGQWAGETRGGVRIRRPAEFLAALARKGVIYQFQLHWQPDPALCEDPEAVRQNLHSALTGNLAYTRQGEYLSAINDNFPHGDFLEVPVEVKAADVRFALNGRQDYLGAQGQLVHDIYQALPNVLTQPSAA